MVKAYKSVLMKNLFSISSKEASKHYVYIIIFIGNIGKYPLVKDCYFRNKYFLCTSKK